MSDELSPEMLEEATPDLLTLEDEDGKEVTFEVIDATEVNGTRYLAVIPYQEDPESLQEDAELILMRIGTDDEGEYMDIVDDDEELITVGKVFENACVRCTTSTTLNCSKRLQGLTPCAVRFVAAL